MRAVFDTNIFISAFAIPGGQAEKAILKIIEGQDDLVISKEIIGEILSVLSSKFAHEKEALSHLAVNLSELAELVRPDKRVRVFTDEPDNRILECAISGKADVIVTGDKDMLRLREYEGIKIISLRQYLESTI